MAEEYRQRLDNNVEKLVENFKGLVKTARIKDKTNTSREAYQNSIYATTLVQASESLLRLVSELKLSVALGDFEGMNQTVDNTAEDLFKRRVAGAFVYGWRWRSSPLLTNVFKLAGATTWTRTFRT